MGTYTTNLNLEKPSDADTADIAVINGNMDVLDSVIGDVDTATDGDLQTQVDTLRDSVSLESGVASMSFRVTANVLAIVFTSTTGRRFSIEHYFTSKKISLFELFDDGTYTEIWSFS